MNKIKVLYPSNQFAYWVTEEEARRMVRAGVGERVGSRQKWHALRLFQGPMRPVPGTNYVYHHDDEDNPQGVFALRRITHLPRELFFCVQTDCLVAAC